MTRKGECRGHAGSGGSHMQRAGESGRHVSQHPVKDCLLPRAAESQELRTKGQNTHWGGRRAVMGPCWEQFQWNYEGRKQVATEE